jgi:hypothetical protein
MDNPFDPHQPLNETTFAIFDVETTGLSPAYGHRVCEVACLRVCNGLELDRFESLVDPGRAISPGAFYVNRITPEMLRGAPTVKPANKRCRCYVFSSCSTSWIRNGRLGLVNEISGAGTRWCLMSGGICLWCGSVVANVRNRSYVSRVRRGLPGIDATPSQVVAECAQRPAREHSVVDIPAPTFAESCRAQPTR